jgi:hypothetical protein
VKYQGSAQDYIFSTKFKQIMPFCIISWSNSKLFMLNGGFFADWWLGLTSQSADWQGQNTGISPFSAMFCYFCEYL